MVATSSAEACGPATAMAGSPARRVREKLMTRTVMQTSTARMARRSRNVSTIRAYGGCCVAASLLLAGPGSAESLRPPVSPACISSPFGYRHAVGPHAPAGFHNGVDLPAQAGALVHAAADGTVLIVKRQG